LGAFGIRRFRMLTRVLRVLLGLGSVLSALGMVILAMSLGRGAMGLCSHEVPPPCCVRLSCCFLMLADKLRLYAQATSIVAEQSANLVLIEGARPIR
jgi:hypothetical protein